MVSNQPFASSPRSLNGTGYGTLKGKNLKENAALSNWKRMRLPSFTDAAAYKERTTIESKILEIDIRLLKDIKTYLNFQLSDCIREFNNVGDPWVVCP